MKIWAKEWKNNHMLRDTTIEDCSDDTRTHKVFRALEQVCYEFDLPKPLWLFYQDSFVEEIPFQYLELQVIEED